MKIVILAGGSGTRLWPLSRSNYPKQFLSLEGEESFLQKTVRRNRLGEVYILTNAIYYHDVVQQVKAIDPALEERVLVEPAQKNTAPAIAYAVEQIVADGDEVFFIAPADHMIAPEERYWELLKEGERKAREGHLVTFGVRPNRPETGYGYIRTQADGVTVGEFVEKPDLETARTYLQKGNYFWNAGMFAFTKELFSQELTTHCPEIAGQPFEKMPSTSLDYALMEKSERVAMIPLDLTWSDIGSWENVYELLEKDAHQNVTQGDVLAVDTTNSLIMAEKRHVSTIGIDNVLIVETDDVVLVADKERSQEVKAVVAKLKTLGKKIVEEHPTTHRPWGSYTVLMESERYKIKRIDVHPHQKLSLQMHYHRSEHWVVVSGTALVTIEGEERLVHEGESIFVPKSATHRVQNPGKVPLEIIEVQVGEYLGEDDIIRFEDVYGRIKTTSI